MRYGLRRIEARELKERRFSGTLFEVIEFHDFRTTADLTRSSAPDERSWNRIIALTPPVIPDPVRKSDGTPDLRYHSAGLINKAWPIHSLLKLLKRAIACGDRLDSGDYDDLIVYAGTYKNKNGRYIPAAYMLEFDYYPIYLKNNGYSVFLDGVSLLLNTVEKIKRNEQVYI